MEETDPHPLALTEYESRLQSYQHELGAKLSVTRMESMETKLHCDFLNDGLLQHIYRMEIIQDQLERSCEENMNMTYPDNLFLNLYQSIETIPGLKEREKLMNEAKSIQNAHEQLILEHMETISTLRFELKNIQSENSQQHQAEDRRFGRVRQQNVTLGEEVQKLEKELLESKLKSEQLRLQVQAARMSQEKQNKESKANLEKFAQCEAEVHNLRETLQAVRDELSTTKRELEDHKLENGELRKENFPASQMNLSHWKHQYDSKSDLDDGREKQNTIRLTLHRASSLTDLEVSYQTLRAEYLQCQVELGVRDKTILTLRSQLKSKESELLTAINDHTASVTGLKTELLELKSKLTTQDLSVLSMLSDSIKRDELTQRAIVMNLSGMIEEKVNEKMLKERPQDTLLQITDQYSQVMNNYEMEIHSLKEQLRQKDQEIGRLTRDLHEKKNDSEIHAAMDGLRRQMEGFKTQFLQTQLSSPAEIPNDYDIESLSKVIYFPSPCLLTILS
jgi:hypothetical protein